MAFEIERKFLVTDRSIISDSAGTSIAQGYLKIGNSRSVRVRLSTNGCTIAVKGSAGQVVRSEVEEAISEELAIELLAASEPNVVTKMRYPIVHGAHLWTIDEFQDDNRGLLIAEIELDHPRDEFVMPSWADRDVTEDVRYFNEYLAFQPYKIWGLA
jgi:adenylate cyclase